MEWMIEKKDRQKVELLRYLVSRPEIKLPLKVVQEYFDWSKYMVLSTIRGLFDDMQEFYGEEPSFFKLSEDEKMIELTQNRNVDSNVFALQYMRQSIPWQLMRETFNETMRSYEDFAVRNLTTVSSARNGKLQLDEFFEQHGITITQDYTLTGNEAEIRAVYFRLFVKYFADRIFPFSAEELALANQAIKAIIKIISPEETKIRQSKRIALRFSTAIWLERLQLGHFVEDDAIDDLLLPNDQLNDKSQRLIAYFEQQGKLRVPDISDEHLHREARYALIALFSIDVGYEVGRYENLTPSAAGMIEGFIRLVDRHYDDFFGYQLTARERDLIREVFFGTLIGAVVSPTSDDRQMVVRFDAAYEQFPLMADFTLNLIDDIAERRQLDVTAARNAYFEILYVGFASVFDMHRVFPKIKVAIDINYQFGLEAILTDMLLGLRAMNVEVSEFIDDDTDILISDINHAQIPEENTFIWPTMPTSLDFEQLRRRLSEMKVEKFEEERGIKLRFPTN